jgi:hypothetical protein
METDAVEDDVVCPRIAGEHFYNDGPSNLTSALWHDATIIRRSIGLPLPYGFQRLLNGDHY